jgi:hypothetical protein
VRVGIWSVLEVVLWLGSMEFALAEAALLAALESGLKA